MFYSSQEKTCKRRRRCPYRIRKVIFYIKIIKFKYFSLLVIADGVGSWNKYGVDPKEYAWALCNKIKEIYEENNSSQINNDPLNILTNASSLIKIPGSSTCSLLILDRKLKKLKSACLGDSLFMIICYSEEENKFIFSFKSEDQVHKFNQPFQLGIGGDNPDKAIIKSHDVKNKDIIIVASDG
jgi:protein phosphatase PTC7